MAWHSRVKHPVWKGLVAFAGETSTGQLIRHVWPRVPPPCSPLPPNDHPMDAHNAETEPNEQDWRGYITYFAEDTARDAWALNSGVEQVGFFPARCLLTVGIGRSASRTTAARRAPFSISFLDDCYGIESIGHPVRTVLVFGAHAGFLSMHARNTYPDAIIHAYEPNPNMKQFLEHQSGIEGFTYSLEAGWQEG
jgi:hypothetical protein